jgi:hypothetical protein
MRFKITVTLFEIHVEHGGPLSIFKYSKISEIKMSQILMLIKP